MAGSEADDLFERWRALLDQGRFVTAEVLCKGHPHLVGELERRIQGYAVNVLGSRFGQRGSSVAERDAAESAADEETNVPSAPPEAGDDSVANATIIETRGIGPINVVDSDGRPGDTAPITPPAGPGATSSKIIIPDRDGPPTDDVRVHAVGTYEGYRLLARGGLGEVFVSRDQEFHRDVVLKFIRRDVQDEEATTAQFELEAEITARLEHPGVVPMYGIGRSSDGRVFQVMRYIRGDSFEVRIARFHNTEGLSPGERNIEFRALLSRFASVCQTIAYAHTRGIVHRDIKPDNVMIGKYGETLVVDWGLAMSVERRQQDRVAGEQTIKPKADGADSSSDGLIVGTPSYMSPEQAEGSPDVGPACDVYGLGAVLYKLLTGRLAFPGSRVSDVLRHVRKGKFESPRSRDRSIPASLEAICLKAMHHEPGERYATAQDLAGDVEAFLAGEPVSAYAEPWTARVGRWVRRHERLARAIATLVLLVVVGGSVWATASLLHERHVVEQRVEGLARQGELHGSLLRGALGRLRDDVGLLARRPGLVDLLVAADGDGIDPIALVPVSEEFEEFVGLNPDYMQARLLDARGMEVVRIERTVRGGPVVWAGELQDKSERTYFTETRDLPAGEVYFSPIDLNVENGRRQWGYPVIRSATPLHDAEGTFRGIVVINLHFAHLAEALGRSRGEADITLANESGAILLHAEPDVPFVFERGLDLPIDAMYPFLAEFLESDALETDEFDVQPRSVLLLVAKSTEQEVTDGLASLAETIVTDSEFDGIDLRRTRYAVADIGFEGADARTLLALVGVTPAQREAVEERVAPFAESVRLYVLPGKSTGRQAVHARRIPIGTTGRNLVLVMTVDY